MSTLPPLITSPRCFRVSRTRRTLLLRCCAAHRRVYFARCYAIFSFLIFHRPTPARGFDACPPPPALTVPPARPPIDGCRFFFFFLFIQGFADIRHFPLPSFDDYVIPILPSAHFLSFTSSPIFDLHASFRYSEAAITLRHIEILIFSSFAFFIILHRLQSTAT